MEREGGDSTTADRRPRSIWNRCYATQRRTATVAARAARHFHETERIVRIWTECESETTTQKPRYNTQRTIRLSLAREK